MKSSLYTIVVGGILASNPWLIARSNPATNGLHEPWPGEMPCGINIRRATGNGMIALVNRKAQIWSSVDARHWNEQSTGSASSLYDIAFGNGVFVAVGNEGALLTSFDGVTWMSRCSFTEERLRSIAFGNGRFVAVGYEGTIIVSPDGNKWSLCRAPTRERLQATLFTNDCFVVVGWNGTILSSSRGVRWSSRHFGLRAKLEHLDYFDGQFKASDSTRNVIAVSANGRKWTSP